MNKLEFKEKFLLGVLVLVGLVIANAVLLTMENTIIIQQQKEFAEAERPPDLAVITIVDSSCEECTDISSFTETLAKLNINISDSRVLESSDEESSSLISSYQITRLPVVIIQGELDKNSEFKQYLDKVSERRNGAAVITHFSPPYKDLESGEIRGIATVTFLFDTTCDTCYDPRIHAQSLQRLGMGKYESKFYDVNSEEGKELIGKYDITLIPTIVIEGDIGAYPQLQAIWPQVGTIESGSLIFRNGVSLMGTYKNLESGEIIIPQKKITNTYENVTPQEFNELSLDSDIILLDVRTPKEYEEGHIEGSILIPVDELTDRLQELDKDKKILVYCRSGNRSAKASKILTENGFNQVYNLEKGILEWENQGLPVIR